MKNKIYTYPASGVYKKDFTDIIKHLPEVMYKKMDLVDGSRIISLSLEYQEGFTEYWKDKIKEPNIGFIETVKKIYNLK